jgi:cell division septation protein DedD
MSDFARDRLDGADEDRLPWLEAVEEDDDDRGVGAGKLIAAVIVGLIALGLVVGGLFWLRDQGSGDTGGQGELIAAPAGDYKEKPSEPGGMKVEGTGDIAYGASEGAEVTSSIDLSALPEAPIAGPNAVRTTDLPPSTAKPAAAPAPVPAKIPAPAPAPAGKAPAVAIAQAPAKPKPLPVKPAAVPEPAPVAPEVAGGAAIQLGAFSSEAKANAAWKSLSGRFAFLSGLSSSVTPVTTDSGTLYRLRASAGSEASKLCARLKIAGESCVVVN